jgi:GTPase
LFDNISDLIKQISLGEDSCLELKRTEYRGDSVSGPHGNTMADELAAMVNSRSGVFVLGVDDDHRITGIPKDKLDITETWLRDIANDLAEPPLECGIQKLWVRAEGGVEKPLIRVDVPRNLACPLPHECGRPGQQAGIHHG